METKEYTKEQVIQMMEIKDFWKQYENQESEKHDDCWTGKLRSESLNELAQIFSAKMVPDDNTPDNALQVNGDFQLTPEQIHGLRDPLGTVIIGGARQMFRQLFTYGGTSEFARLVDATKLQIHEPDEKDGMKVRVVVQFHVWYATTKNGLEPTRGN